jgi:AraC family transcriptional activator FtrA
VLPLMPGPTMGASSVDFVPHFSFAEYDTLIGSAPDLIAIPWFDGGYSPQADAVVLDWIRGHFGKDTTILGICSGDIILADTGLLAGRNATSNTGTWQYVESHSPTTNWIRNVRYVDDGNIITTQNLSSGIAGALHVVDRFAGRAKALEVANQIGYAHTEVLDDPAFQSPNDSLVVRATLAGLVATTDRIGVVLYDGVTELGISGLIDPYLGTFSARTYAMAPERTIVHTRAGFQLVPRYTFDTVPSLDRVLVPASDNDTARRQAGAAWTKLQPTTPAEDLYASVGHGESAYDVSFRDLARTHDGVISRVVANMLFYPVDEVQFRGAAWPVDEVLGQLGLMVLGAAIVFGATHLRRIPVLAFPRQQTRYVSTDSISAR